MSRGQQFLDNIAANFVSWVLICVVCAVGATMLALFAAATHGLSRWEQASIVGLSSVVLMALVVIVYVGIRAKRLHTLSCPPEAKPGALIESHASSKPIVPMKIPEIVGDFSHVEIIRHGLVVVATNNRQRWMMVGLSINVHLNSSEAVRINDIRLRTHKMSPPCRSLLPLLPPQRSELEANVWYSFGVQPQIEYWHDDAKTLPSSL